MSTVYGVTNKLIVPITLRDGAGGSAAASEFWCSETIVELLVPSIVLTWLLFDLFVEL